MMIRTRLSQKFAWFLLFSLVLGAPTVALADSDRESLEEAYKKEFAYLESQKRALTERIEELDRRESRSVDGAQKEIEDLEADLIRLRDRNEDLEETVAEIERDADTGEEGQSSVASTLEQANTTFEKWDREVDIPEEAGDQEAAAAAIEELFEVGVDLISQHHSVRRQEGEFFGRDGKRLEGEIVEVGNVAAYGVSDSAAGALVPAGEGRLKLAADESAATARALASGERPEQLDIFLFEERDEAVEEREEKTAREVIDSGGVIAWIIVALGVLGLLLVLVRAVLLWRAGANNRGLVAQAGQLVFRGEIERARKLCADGSGAASRVLQHTLAHIDVDGGQIEDVLDEAILHELPTLERFGSAIMVFAAVAPLLGLLGTVTGMISTFDVITEFGTGDPKLLSGGISEALVTTQLGLIVAIPLLLIGNLLKGWSNAILDNIQRGALRLVNLARLRADREPVGDAAASELPESEAELAEYLEGL